MLANSSIRLLVVDDDQILRKSLAQFLELHGKQVMAVDSAVAARKALDHESFDAFVFDVGLPDGRGHALVEPQRAARTLMISAQPGFEGERPAHGARCIGKPLDLSVLNRLIDELTACA